MEANNSTWPYNSENAKNIVQAILSAIGPNTQTGDFENGSKWPYDNEDAKNIVEAILKLTGVPIKYIYAARLTDSGFINANTFINTFPGGGSLSYTSVGTGSWEGAVNGGYALKPFQTFCMIGQALKTGGGGNLVISYSTATITADTLELRTFDAAGAPADGVLSNSYVIMMELG